MLKKVLFFLCSWAIFAVTAADSDVILDRLRAAQLAKPLPAETVLRGWIAALRPDGSWPDIDYKGQNRSNWEPAPHMNRVLRLAQAWAKPGQALHRDAAAAEAVRRAAAYWTKHRFTADNWWWNDIRIPENMVDAMIVAPELFNDPAERRAALTVVRQAKFGMTGQNRCWLAGIVLKRALLENDGATVKKAVGEITAELRISGEEGIRADGSFHQHGPQLQFGNYGLGFLGSMSEWSLLLAGTNFAFDEKKRDLLAFLVFDGFRWVLWKGRFDLLAAGRQLGQGAQRSKANGALRAIDALRRADPENAERYAAILESNRKNEAGFTGNRYFFDSDYMVHRRPGWYASVRMNSVRTTPVEDRVNWDNALGRYLSDGVMLLMKSGDEYRDIAACWDWTRLPGSTLPAVPILDEAECRRLGIKVAAHEYARWTLSRKWRRRGESKFVGGVSDGERGAVIYTQNLDGVMAKKAYFFDYDAIYALGCGISSTSAYPVATTVESRLKSGEVKRGGNWIWHDGTGYVGKNLEDRSGFRDGDWRYISGGLKNPVPDRKELFTILVDHGTGCRDAKYEYVILPGATPEATANRQGGKIISNTPELQAVEFADGARAAVFHKPGRLGEFKADKPGLYLISRDGTHRFSSAVK